jgi:lysophospholipase L1-like esterase
MHFTASTINPWIQSAAPTAGIYTGMFIHHSTTSPITEAPPHGSFIKLNLSEDLRTLEFANSTLALIADKRPLSLEYKSLKARPQISLTLNLDESSKVWSFEGLYTQGPKKLLFTSGEDSITKHEGPLLFLGDSITAAWEQFPSIWNAAFSAYRPINYAVPGYTTDDIERDIRAGRLDDLHPKAIVLLIGTNNFYRDNVEKVTQKIPRLLQSIRAKAPHTQIILLGILPRGEKSNDPFRPLITATNKVTATLDNDWNIHYLDFGAAYLNPDGSLIEGVMPDFLHLSGTGYQIWADQMAALLHAVMTNGQIP